MPSGHEECTEQAMPIGYLVMLPLCLLSHVFSTGEPEYGTGEKEVNTHTVCSEISSIFLHNLRNHLKVYCSSKSMYFQILKRKNIVTVHFQHGYLNEECQKTKTPNTK